MPFWTASLQLGAAHLPSPPQTPLSQSPATEQTLPSAQGSHPLSAPPPQSVSLSPLFLTVSTQVGATHVPPVEQTPEVQSAPEEQPAPTPHLA